MRILAVGAHPDDVAIGCGGTLALATRYGDETLAVIMTTGARRGAPGVRIGESIAASRLLGTALLFGNLTDGDVDDGDVDAFLEPIIEKFCPNAVFTHSTKDSHPDHQAVALGALAAGRNVPSILCFESPSTLEFHPNVYVDITTSMDAKRDAIDCHRSQIVPGGRVGDEITIVKAKAHGFDCRTQYAEAFQSPRLLWEPSQHHRCERRLDQLEHVIHPSTEPTPAIDPKEGCDE